MKNLFIITAFLLLLSCNGNVKDRKNESQTILIEWTGEIDKPIYNIILCTNCEITKSTELRQLEVSDKAMEEILKLEFNHQLIINEENRIYGIKQLNYIHNILEKEKSPDDNLNDIRTFIKRIS